MSNEEKVSITVLLPGGRLPLDIMDTALQIARKYNLGIYLSTLQNLRLLDVPLSLVDEVKKPLAALGADFKAAGKFPIPRVCVGRDHCKLGLIDTSDLSGKILSHFAGRKNTKAKLKIAIAACALGCSGIGTSDIGIVATRNGYDVYAGGKGGTHPKSSRRIRKDVSEDEVIRTLDTLIEFHDLKTATKQRMYKLLDDPDFPFAETE
ncbi:MAG: nitrite reductase [Desulfocapsaceae bacterium]|nr:nitrite reductase [Desulfocapsaceae bacterium]